MTSSSASRMTKLALTFALTTAAFILGIPGAARAENTAQAAKPAAPLASLPSLSLPDLEGKTHDSKEWKDKVVVLDFWATWCTGCRETIPVLVRLNEKFGAKGLAITGISVDKGPKEKIAKFARKQKMTYSILWDAEDTLSKVFGYEGLPSVYVFGRDGKLLKAMPAYTSSEEKTLEALVDAQFK